MQCAARCTTYCAACRKRRGKEATVPVCTAVVAGRIWDGRGGVLGAPGEFVLVGCGIGRGGLHAHYVDEVCHFETEEGVDGARVLAFSASWGVKYLRVNPAWYALVRTVRKKHTKETTYVPRRCISPMAPILQAPRSSMALVCVKGGTYFN